jgi:hypothetical protein
MISDIRNGAPHDTILNTLAELAAESNHTNGIGG